jgi:hypothetical protein
VTEKFGGVECFVSLFCNDVIRRADFALVTFKIKPAKEDQEVFQRMFLA